MKTYLAAVALVTALAHPAAAVTFPSLTTIYVGSGVLDDGSADENGQATSIHCSNVSGASVQVRALVLHNTGAVAGSLTVSLAHGATITFSTHQTRIFSDAVGDLSAASVFQGVLNVEATNSAIFCSAVLVDAQNVPPIFMSSVHLVRVNPHPGTVE